MTSKKCYTIMNLYKTKKKYPYLGLVLVSTGVLKFGKPSAVRDRITIRKLKLNADENLAYAA